MTDKINHANTSLKQSPLKKNAIPTKSPLEITLGDLLNAYHEWWRYDAKLKYVDRDTEAAFVAGFEYAKVLLDSEPWKNYF